ncbi:MAG: META domain-containing protein [Anaerolineae bacterium]|nr:META domain-containing protein [Thermoflexales bacterium]MDW8408527.1 META domain-containing protein [Anaerolineae bacterium]
MQTNTPKVNLNARWLSRVSGLLALIAATLIAGCDAPTPVPPSATPTALPRPTLTPTHIPSVTPSVTPSPEPVTQPTLEPTAKAIVPRDALAGTSWSVITFGPLRVQVRPRRGTTLTLQFGQNGEVAGLSGCNTFTSTYTIDGDAIDIRAPARTRKSCGLLTMRQEYYYLEALEQTIRFSLEGDRLRLVYNRGRGAIHLAQHQEYDDADDADVPMGAYETILYVGPQRIPCVGGAERACLAVREAGEVNYRPYNGALVGFDYIEGYDYELRVQAKPALNPAADRPTVEYTVIKIVRRTRVDARATPVPTLAARDGATLEQTGWRLHAIESAGVETVVPAGVEITLLFGADGMAGGLAGCNSYVGRYRINDGAITFSSISATRKVCLDATVVAQEQTYLSALEAVETVARFEGQLILTFDGGAGVLRFLTIP